MIKDWNLNYPRYFLYIEALKLLKKDGLFFMFCFCKLLTHVKPLDTSWEVEYTFSLNEPYLHFFEVDLSQHFWTVLPEKHSTGCAFSEVFHLFPGVKASVTEPSRSRMYHFLHLLPEFYPIIVSMIPEIF